MLGWQHVSDKLRLTTMPWIAAFLLLAATVPAWAPAEQNEQAFSMRAVEAALLAEDWAQVAELLKSVTADPQERSDSVTRLILGHACLALNRNNDAVRLFWQTTTDVELQRWTQWTGQFAEAHEDAAIAHYLKGDALSRRGNWKDAISVYDHALTKSPNHALTFNARGVAHAHAMNPNKARSDFEDAIEYSRESLADAYANVGAWCIQMKEGPDGAYEAYGKALQLAAESKSDFSLALHGKGCAGLILGRKESIEDLNNAIAQAPCPEARELMVWNTAKCAAKTRGLQVEEVLVKINKSGSMFGIEFGYRHGADGSFGFGGKIDFGKIGGGIGGVEINPADINWDEGDWPFREAYALVRSASQES